MKNTFGNAVSLTIFGESHGPAVGAVLDGLAAGLPVDEAAIAAAMDRRRARGDGLSTARTEADEVEFLSGRVPGPHYRHPRHAADPQPKHPQRRLRQDRRPFAPRPRRFYGLRQHAI